MTYFNVFLRILRLGEKYAYFTVFYNGFERTEQLCPILSTDLYLSHGQRAPAERSPAPRPNCEKKNPALRQSITLVAEITNTPSVIDQQKRAVTDSTLYTGSSELSYLDLIVNW